MKRFFPIILFLFFIQNIYSFEKPCLTTPPHKTGNSSYNFSEPFTIGTWNVEWFPGGHHNEKDPNKITQHIADVAGFLKKENPTILFLCEVRDLKSLERLFLDYPFLACSESTDPNSTLPNLGLALMSKIPWEEIWFLDFSNLADTRDRPSRGILGVKFRHPLGFTFTLYGVHLKSNQGYQKANELKRQRAIEYLFWDWEQRGLDPAKDPIIILGDFNTSSDDYSFSNEETLKSLSNAGFSSVLDSLPQEQRSTTVVDPQKPYRPLEFDHILFSKPLAPYVSEPGWAVRISPELSDHFPVFVRFKKSD